ncbi:hypothetical protein FOZ63_029042 [Perkinsus olseni]|uniref:Uncharacterized protein n=1 Tax=Perkinsus olseni TaxID=32597 RepID=A0A7J6UL65_PEROL|nr:hypothetical protein FOZ63_029042 [Perkinsus olseni]
MKTISVCVFVAALYTILFISGCKKSSGNTTTGGPTTGGPTTRGPTTTASPTGPTTSRPTSTPSAPTPDGTYLYNGTLTAGINGSVEVHSIKSSRIIDRMVVAGANPYKVIAKNNGPIPFHMVNTAGKDQLIIDNVNALPSIFKSFIKNTTILFFQSNNSIVISVPPAKISIALHHVQ